MARWFAECTPCRWRTDHSVQDDAIRAAEDHVIEAHRGTPPFERMQKRIGHVQNRDENAIGYEFPAPAPVPELDTRLQTETGTAEPIETAPAPESEETIEGQGADRALPFTETPADEFGEQHTETPPGDENEPAA